MFDETDHKVLVIEIDEAWQGIIKRRLEKWRFKVDISSSREDAFERIQNNDYLFATLDLSLHKDKESYEGLELLRDLEKSEISIPIIVISANSINEYTVDACNFDNVTHYSIKEFYQMSGSMGIFEKKILTIKKSYSRYQTTDFNLNLLDYSKAKKIGAYILFMDCEDFSKYSDEEQSKIFSSLIDAAKNTEVLNQAIEGSGFVPLLTGDGMAIIFDDEEYCLFPLKLAFQIQANLKMEVLKYRMRFGIHFGDVYLFKNQMGLKQIIGSHLNHTARIMDFGKGGHILSSEDYFMHHVKKTPDVYVDGLTKKDIGLHKHPKGDEIRIYNYYTNVYGNKSKDLRD